MDKVRLDRRNALLSKVIHRFRSDGLAGSDRKYDGHMFDTMEVDESVGVFGEWDTPVVELVESLPPCPDLARLLADQGDPGGLSSIELVAVIAAYERLTSWVAARQLAAVVALRDRFAAEDATDTVEMMLPEEAVCAEVGAKLRWSTRRVEARVELALSLAERIPEAWAALDTGRLDLAKAEALRDLTDQLPVDQAREVTTKVLNRAPRQTLAGFRQSVRRHVEKLDPSAAAKRREKAERGRRVECNPLPDGMAELRAVLPAEDAMRGFALLTLAAKAADSEDDRGIDARRADVFVDLLRYLADSRFPTLPFGSVTDNEAENNARPRSKWGAGVLIQATVGADILVGLSDRPAELEGYGPIPADVARRLAADATWRRILTDPVSGALLDYGSGTYRPPANLSRHVRARDKTCRFVGCRQPAWRTDLDHTVPFPTGPTSHRNLGALCRRHHRVKHEGGWTLTQPEPGRFMWTSRAGHSYEVEVEPFSEPRLSTMDRTAPVRSPASLSVYDPANDPPPF